MKRLFRAWMMKMMRLPSCQEVEQFAYDYLEGQLEVGLVAKFERHLDGCKTCHRFIESYRKVARPAELAQHIPLDPDFEARVIEFLKNQSG